MFGKTRESNDSDTRIDEVVEGFFGDEVAVAEAVKVDELHHRVTQVEAQISSQFTSMAAYAQIAQEQIEIARSESKNSTERAERRLTQLIERERGDRIDALAGRSSGADMGGGWGAPGVEARLDALERSVGDIQLGLNECLARQKALADAITALFEPNPAALMDQSGDGPIDDLSMV